MSSSNGFPECQWYFSSNSLPSTITALTLGSSLMYRKQINNKNMVSLRNWAENVMWSTKMPYTAFKAVANGKVVGEGIQGLYRWIVRVNSKLVDLECGGRFWHPSNKWFACDEVCFKSGKKIHLSRMSGKHAKKGYARFTKKSVADMELTYDDVFEYTFKFQ